MSSCRVGRPLPRLFALELYSPPSLLDDIAGSCDGTGLAKSPLGFPLADDRVPARTLVIDDPHCVLAECGQQRALLGTVRVHDDASMV